MPDRPVRVAFRVAASARAGGGHAVRCMALAQALRERRATTCFVVGPEALTVCPALKSEEVIIHQGPECELPMVLQSRWPGGVDAAVIDDYDYGAQDERALCQVVSHIMVIDERLDRQHEAHILLDQTYDRLPDAIRPFVPRDCEILVGERFALLRPEFAQTRSSLDRSSRRPDGRCRVLVSLGLTDPDGVLDFVLDEFESLSGKVTVDIAIGSGAPNLEPLRRRIASLPWAVLHVDHPAIWSLMAAADLAVGATGVMTWERCCLGLPSIALVLAENQQPNADALAHAGAAIVLGSPSKLARGDLTAAVSSLVDNRQWRTAMGEAAARLVDGLGSQRVADRLLSRMSV